ncbi:MAG: carotenoid biosynthesis protein [Verrucomicrobiota bacterium]
MNQASNAASASPANAKKISNLAGWIANGVFAVAFGLVWTKLVFPIPALEQSNWPEGVLLLAATASAISAVVRTLPLQNVLWGALVIGAIGGLAHALGTLASIPFGPFVFTQAAGPRLFGILPCTIPLLWMLCIYTSRGTARLVLKPWRKTRIYGFWLIGLTAGFSLILDLGLDPFASRVKHYWIWEPTRFPFDWHGTPVVNFAGWVVTALLIMAFVTPMLINKKPGSTPSEYGSFVIWILLNFLFVTSAVTHQFWLAAILCSLAALIVAVLAVRGARW